MRGSVLILLILGLFLALGTGGQAAEAPDGAGHGGPVVPVLLGLVVILVAANVWGLIF